MWLVLAWYALSAAIMLIGSLAGSSAWLRRRADPLRPSTLRWLTVSLPAAGLIFGACLMALDASDDAIFDVGNGAWAPIMAFGVFVTVLATRALVVVKARSTTLTPLFA
jgi:hypothetical protein